jgi:hypothetical protein
LETVDTLHRQVHPNVAKVGGLQSQGAKGEAVVDYCEPLATPDLKPSDFPEGQKRWRKTEPILECTAGLFQPFGLDLH